MPFSLGDVEKHNKGLSPAKKAQWIAVANSVLAKCIKEGGTDASCAPSAIRQANGVVANFGNSLVSVNLLQSGEYEVRTVERQGVKYLVVPVTMMVEGVHHGSRGPLLHTIEDLGHFPAAWNGIPLMIDHPKRDGVNISANDPEVLAKSVGQVFNTHIEENKLKAEAWFNENSLRNISPETLYDILEHRLLEVSVGVFSDEETVPGNWNGEEYTAIARNHRPDHLAILPGGTGACSVEDGCGIRNNSKEGGKMDNNAVEMAMESKRKEMGMSIVDFYAVPRDPPGESKLPIYDASHVRNALARFSQTQGLSADEKTTAMRKIRTAARKFGINAASMANSLSDDAFDALKSAKEVGLYFGNLTENTDQGYLDLVNAARQKVDAMDTNDSVHYLQDVFDSYIVYEVRQRIGGSRMFKQNYQLNNGNFELTGNPVEVRKSVEYTQVNRIKRNNFNKKEEPMENNGKCTPCIEKKVNALIANEATTFTEDDREWLSTLEEKQLDKMTPKKVESIVDNLKKDEPIKLTSEQVLNAMSDEDKAALAYGKKQLAERRTTMIKGIIDNTAKDVWSEKELQAMNEETLQKIFNSVKKEESAVDYSLNGGSLPIVNASKEEIPGFYSMESLEEELYGKGGGK